MHQAFFQGNLVWSDMKGFVRIITNSLWRNNANCNMHRMLVRSPSCRPEIVERFLPLLLPNWSKWEGQFLAQNTIVKVSFFGHKSALSFIYRLSFWTLHCTQSIQLENDDSTDRIHLLRVTQMKSPQFNATNMTTTKNTYLKQAKRQEVCCAGIFGIWWAPAMIAVTRVFLAPKLQTSIPLSWLRQQSVKFYHNSGSSKFRFKR